MMEDQAHLGMENGAKLVKLSAELDPEGFTMGDDPPRVCSPEGDSWDRFGASLVSCLRCEAMGSWREATRADND
jgi:hypothetical protein